MGAGGRAVIHRWSTFNTCICISHVLSLGGDYIKHSRLIDVCRSKLIRSLLVGNTKHV